MVWPCHEERGRVNAEGCDEVKDEGKETKRKTKAKVARQHRWPPQRKEHISLKEVLGMTFFENREDWKRLISQPTDS